MRRSVLLGSVLVLSTWLGGCSDDKAERAAEIATEIRASPDRAEEILAEHDMTIEELEALMFEIASDPELSERYQRALPPAPDDEAQQDDAPDDEE